MPRSSAGQSVPQPRTRGRPEGHVVIVLCAEQGFAGSFNERVLDAAECHLKSDAAELFIIGNRGAMVAAERGLGFGWSAPMVAHAEEVPLLASRITDALYSRLEKSQAARVTVIHAVPAPSATIEIVERALLPFDFARFKVAPRAVPPITTLPPEQLVAELAEEYVYAELCEEIMLSFAAENEARMRAMIAARSNVARKLDELVSSFRRLRQEEITGEIIELSAGSISAAASSGRKHA
jgi:F-type H+-transporting ATPase subunit gamma